jgi:hypothetical protein
MKKRKRLKKYTTCLRKIKKHLRKSARFLRRSLWSKKNLERDAIILGALIFVLSAIFSSAWKAERRKAELAREAQKIIEQNIAAKIDESQKIQESIPVEEIAPVPEQWKTYQNRRFGFQIRYPDSWREPVEIKGINSDKWYYRYRFQPDSSNRDSRFGGFDLAVYSVRIAKEFSDTEEFPHLKDIREEAAGNCEDIDGYLIENRSFPAEEVYIPPDNRCFDSVLLFSMTRDDFIYNLAPIRGDGTIASGEYENDAKMNFPEFFQAASALSLIDIAQPQKTVRIPRVTAPMPIWFAWSGGRRVCAKANDKPSYSDKNKKKHLDMECCLDPDEYPNPNCYYPPGKYGKYLN